MKRVHKDVGGQILSIGDEVVVIGEPDLSKWTGETGAFSQPVFSYLVGKRKRIAAFSEHGEAEIFFRIRSGPLAGLHTVWLEPSLIRKVQKRA